MRTVTLSLTDQEVDLLESLTRFGGYANRSAAARQAIDLLAEQHMMLDSVRLAAQRSRSCIIDRKRRPGRLDDQGGAA